jgi:hypothetical protein
VTCIHSAPEYSHEFMAPWLIITCFGLVDWIYWHLLVQSLLTTIKLQHLKPIFSRTVLPWLLRTRPILVLILRLTSDLRLSRRTHRKHTRCPQMYICEPNRKHIFPYCCIYNGLHSDGNYRIVACVFVAAKCVYRVVPQQRVYMSQYLICLYLFYTFVLFPSRFLFVRLY